MFPFHLRFSIHAHSNSGPKFGIKLLSNKYCKVIKTLSDPSVPIFDDLLHIPTPWHNAVIKINDDDTYYVAKSDVAIKAVEEGYYRGKWVEGDLKSGIGGYFNLSKVPMFDENAMLKSQLDHVFSVPII